MPRRPLTALLATMLALLASACAPALCPRAGGAAWYELATPHFRLKTDVSETEATAFVTAFEVDYDRLASTAFRGVDLAELFDVIVLRNEGEFAEWVIPIFAGLYVKRFPLDPERSSAVILYAGDDPKTQAAVRVTFLHELTHRFIARAYLPVPTWLNEGLAEYDSTLSVTGDRVSFGDMPPNVRVVAPDRPLPVRDLLRGTAATFYDGNDHGYGGSETRSSNYETAWAFVHFLKNGPKEYRSRFTAFLHELRAREPADGAWAKAFGDVPEGTLESAFRSYVEEPTWPSHSHPLAPSTPAAPASRRAMTDAEVHVTRARMLSAGHGSGRVGEELALLRAHGETPAEAQYWQGALELLAGHPLAAHARFVSALALAPNDPRFQYADILAIRRWLSGSPPPPKRDQGALHAEVERLLEGLTESAVRVEELSAVASFLARSGRLELAQERADRALREDPDAPLAHEASAYVFSQRERFDDAVLEQTRAIQLAGRAGAALEPTLATYRAARDRARERAQAALPEGPKTPVAP